MCVLWAELPPQQLQAAIPCAGAQFGGVGFCSQGFVQLVAPSCAMLIATGCAPGEPYGTGGSPSAGTCVPA